MGTKVGLVCSTRLSKHYGLPMMVFGTRRRVVLATRQAPTFQPLLDADHPSMQSILACSRTLRGPVELLSPSTHQCTLDWCPVLIRPTLDLPLGGVFQQSCAERLPMMPSTLRGTSASLTVSRVHRTSWATWPTCGPIPSGCRHP